MHRHVRTTVNRVDRWLKHPLSVWYEDSVPLKAVFTHDINPIPFRELGSRKWRPIRLGATWGRAWDTAWFRFTGAVPAAWAGKEAFFRIDTDSESCVFDEKGNPLAGLTGMYDNDSNSRKKAIYPVPKGCAGKKVSLLIEAVAMNLFRACPTAALKQASLVTMRRDRWEFYHDIQFLYDLYKTLPEQSPRKERILYALGAALNAYNNGTAEEVRQARAALKGPLSAGANASAHNVSAIGHAHLDLAWLWPVRETKRKAYRTFSSALKYMQEYPEYKFGASQAQLYEFVKESHPPLYAKVKEAVKKGRWELQGGMWVECDCNVTGGESLVRQLLVGKAFFREEFGVDVDNVWIPDVFGYSAALPQIMKLSGIKYFMTQKISWNHYNKFPYHTFLWEGIDGTRIFSHFPPADTYNGNCLPHELIYGSKNFAEKDRASRWLYLFGIGDGGGGPGRHHIELLRRSKDCEEVPKVTPEFARDFFRKAEKDISDLPVWQGELYLETHRGTYTTQARNKKLNRYMELLLRDMELLGCYDLPRYPQEQLARFWKTVLFNQFHDVIPGSSIGWVYKDSRKQYEEIKEKALPILAGMESGIEKRIDTSGEGRPIVLMNTLSWDRPALAEIPLKEGGSSFSARGSDGSQLPCQVINGGGSRKLLVQADVPSMGHSVIFLEEAGKKERLPGVEAARDRLENELLRVKFDRDGYITSVYDKEEGREVLPQGKRGNLFSLYDDKPYDMPAWDLEIYYEEKPPRILPLESSAVRESGPVRACIVQKRKTGKSSMVQQVRLAAGSKLIEFSTHVDWKESDKVLKASFPVDVRTDYASFDIQYGHVQRPVHRNTTWDIARYEVAAQKWADLSGPDYGAALINDCKYGHKVLRDTLELTLLRSPKEPDPEADMCAHAFSYAFYPHSGDIYRSDVIRRGYEFNVPVRAVEARRHTGKLPACWSAFRIDRENIIIESVKKSEDGSCVIVRMYEAFRQKADAEIECSFSVREVVLVDLLERRLQKLAPRGNKIRLTFRPFEIKTLKLKIDGIAGK